MKKFTPIFYRTFFALFFIFLYKLSFSQVNVVPVTDGGFETGATFPLNNWILLNGGNTNRVWQVGTGQGVSAGIAAAFSGNSPTTVGTDNVSRVVHFYRSVTFPAGTEGIEFTFAYKQPTTDVFLGVIWDGMEISLQSAAPVAGTRPAAPIFRQGANAYAAFTNLIGTISGTAYAGTTQNLVFTFFSDAVSPVGNVGVDNIAVKHTTCKAPSGVGASSITATTATVSWAAPTPAPTDYDLYYNTTGGIPSFITTPSVSAIAGTSANITGLTANTTYYVWVRSNCGGTKSLWTPMPSFLTACAATSTKTATVSGALGVYTWTSLPWSPAGTPTNCNDVVINYNRATNGAATTLITLDVPVNINSLTINGNYGGTGVKSLQLQTAGFNVNIQGNLSLSSTGGSPVYPNQSQVVFLGTALTTQSKITIGGTTTVGKTTDTQISSLGGATGSSPTFIFKDNVVFNNYSSSSSPGTYIFDKAGAQTLANNTLDYVIIFDNALIGQINNTVLNVSGTPAGNALYTGVSGGNLTVKSGASLILPDGSAFSQLGNSATAQGTFSLGAGATLKLGGNTSNITIAAGAFPGYTNNNFPAHFATTTLNSTSTVEYNSVSGLNQTVYAPVTYGNLMLTNGTGSGSTIKDLITNITGIAGNLTVNSFATFNQSSFTANRTGAVGVLTLNAKSIFRLSGGSGGQTGSNFPLNFSSMTADSTSTTEYYGGTQSIFGGITYGNLVLAGTLAKSAPAGALNINGNFSKTTATTFNHNSGSVVFGGPTGWQTYSSVVPVVDFFDLTNNNVNALVINSDCNINRELLLGTGSKLNLAGGNIILKSSNSITANVAIIPLTASINYTGAGRFSVERYIPLHNKAWQFLAVPISDSAQTVKQAWQEGSGSPNQNINSGFGTQITSNVPNATMHPKPGFDVYTPAGPSMKSYKAMAAVWKGIDSTGIPIINQKGYMLFVRGDRSVTQVAPNPGSSPTATRMRVKGKIYAPATPPPVTTVPATKFESIGNPYASAIDLTKLTLNEFGGDVQDIFYVWDPKLTNPGPSVYGYGGYRTFTRSGSTYDVTPMGGTSYPGNICNTIQSGQAFLVKSFSTAGTVKFTEACKVSSSNNINRTQLPTGKKLRTNLYVIKGNERILVDGNMVQYDRSFSNQVDKFDADKLVISSGEGLGLSRSEKVLAVERRSNIQLTDTVFYNLTGVRIQEYELEITPVTLQEPGLQAWLEDIHFHTKTPVSLGEITNIRFNVGNDPGSYAPGRFRLVFMQKKKHLTQPVTSINIQHDHNKAANGAAKTKGGISVYPNPVVDGSMRLQFINQAPGNYNITLLNKLGQVVYNNSIQLSSADRIKTIPLAGIIAGSYQLSILSAEGNKTTIQVILQ